MSPQSVWPLFTMNQSPEEKITLLEQFDSDLEGWFNGKAVQGGREVLRKSLNEMVPMARTLIREARCQKFISASPPPAIGGPVLQNVDPFDMLFESYYSMSFIPTIRDMTQQAIGVLRSGRLEEVKVEPERKDAVVYKELAAPETVTLIWLVRHVPVKLWLMAGGALLAVFTLGIKASTWSFVREILSLGP